MFVRIKTSPNSPKKAVQIVESFREGDKVKQKIVRHVGTALTDKELEALLELAEYIKSTIEQESQPGLFSPEDITEMVVKARSYEEGEEERIGEEKELHVNLKELREQQRIIVGIHEVYGKVYKELGFEKVFSSPKRKPSAVKNLFHIVMGRLANPSSKMATVDNLSENFGIELSLPSVYRMMDLIDDEVIKNIQSFSYEAARGIFKESIKVAFYDCTTLYFESFTEDELKQNGYSKDMKFNQPQVLLALLVTEHGLPIGYEVFPGSTFEGHTLKDAITKIESIYDIKEIILVADSAMLSKDNINLLESLGKKYIIGARIKNLPSNIQEQVLDKNSYIKIRQEEDEEEYAIKEIGINEKQRLIVSYSGKNAKKDAYERQKSIDKLISKLNKKKTSPSDLISNYGYKKFLKIRGESVVEVDKEKVEKEAHWDGLHGVITNDFNMTPEEIIAQYHGLWQVEDCFRISKHDLKVRPIFHWTPQRVRAHIAICFMALTCARHLSYRVKVQKEPMSVERIRQILTSIQISILKHMRTGKLYAIPSVIRHEAKKIYQTVGLKLSDVPFLIK